MCSLCPERYQGSHARLSRRALAIPGLSRMALTRAQAAVCVCVCVCVCLCLCLCVCVSVCERESRTHSLTRDKLRRPGGSGPRRCGLWPEKESDLTDTSTAKVTEMVRASAGPAAVVRVCVCVTLSLSLTHTHTNTLSPTGPAAAAGPNLAMYESGPISVQLSAYLKNKAAKAEVPP